MCGRENGADYEVTYYVFRSVHEVVAQYTMSDVTHMLYDKKFVISSNPLVLEVTDKQPVL